METKGSILKAGKLLFILLFSLGACKVPVPEEDNSQEVIVCCEGQYKLVQSTIDPDNFDSSEEDCHSSSLVSFYRTECSQASALEQGHCEIDNKHIILFKKNYYSVEDAYNYCIENSSSEVTAKWVT